MEDMLPDWWSYQTKAYKEKDSEKAKSIYIDGINKFPENSDLIGNYAVFLSYTLKEYDKAEKYYQKALDI